MAAFFKKLLVLAWKCLVLRLRNWLLTLCELVFPLLVILIASLFYDKIVSGLKSLPFNGRGPSLFPQDYFRPRCPLREDPILAYAPNNSVTDSIMNNFKTGKNIFGDNLTSIEQLTKSGDLETWLATKENTSAIGIVFNEVDPKGNTYKYTIRIVYNAKELDKFYSSSVFFCVQTYLDLAILRHANISINKQILRGNLALVEDTEIQSLNSYMLLFFLMFAYIFFVVSASRDIIEEKSSGIKELMRIMGLPTWMIWLHWVFYTLLVQLPVSIGVSLILVLNGETPLVEGSLFSVWILVFFFTIDCMFIVFAATCLFNRPVIGTSIIVLAWMFMNMLILIFRNFPRYIETKLEQVLVSLIPLQNLCWCFRVLSSFKENNKDFALFEEGYTGSLISVGEGLVIFFLQSVFFALVLIYLDAIKPGPYGIAKPVTFIFSCCKNMLLRKSVSESSTNEQLPDNFEPPPQGMKVGIQVRGLHKTYGFFNVVVAVENVDLDIYKGEIMALLGHNGAGKTTTMSMITGMFSATRGTILVDGKDVKTNLAEFRQSLGLCTQHNLYFPKLTVLEHLIFFGMLKGNSYSESKRIGLDLLALLNMYDKRHARGRQLSGGMQRKLCLAVSLTGDPKVLILDEPTSGLDPESKRHIWNILLALRGERTVLITTHSMEEADVLGNRIAIMGQGKVLCCGTSLFLKKQYGAGYQVHVLKKQKASANSIEQVVQQYIPKYELKQVNQTQVDFKIKSDFVDKFPNMFGALERDNSSLGIEGISVTCTTLEDVFLRVAELSGEKEQSNVLREGSNETARSFEEKRKGFGLCIQRFLTLVLKYIYHRRRNYTSFLGKFVVSSLLVYAAVRGFSTDDNTNNISFDRVLLSMDLYPNSINVIAYDKTNEDVGKIATEIIQSQGGKVELKNFQTDLEMLTYLLPMIQKKLYIYSFRTLLAIVLANDTYMVRSHYSPHTHVPAIANNIIANVLLKQQYKEGKIETINQPYLITGPKGIAEYISETLSRILSYLTALVCIPIAFVILMSDYFVLVTEERVSGFKHQQYIAGAHPVLYWLVNFLCDFSLYMIVISIWLVIIICCGGDFIWNSETSFWLTVVLVLHGINGLFFLYVFSFLFNSVTKSVTIYSVITILTGSCVPLVSIIAFPDWYFIMLTVIISVLSINPTFGAIMCLMNVFLKAVRDISCRENAGEGICEGKWDLMNPSLSVSDFRFGIRLQVYFFAFQWFIYFCLLCIIDLKVIQKLFKYSRTMLTYTGNLDADVAEEVNHVKSLSEAGTDTTPLRVESLNKAFKSQMVVNQVTFHVNPGMCFGLLGVNGAGKTTTFKMLTGEIIPDCGDAFTYEFSVVSNTQQYLSRIGYCPQFDACLNNLTGQQTLNIIGLLRGVPCGNIKQEVSLWLDLFDITEHAGKQAGVYSGGTRRKLSSAMAFIGDPGVVFLDEPTTGVDPASRRKLWSVVQSQQSKGQAIVLTSHSMEECEALCTVITIMRAGVMRCIGSTEQLKSKFGQGYIVLVKIVGQEVDDLERFKADFNKEFPESLITDENVTLISYSVSDRGIHLSRLFSQMLQFKKQHTIIEDFIISNTSLEQVFLVIARGEEAFRRQNVGRGTNVT